MANVIFGDMRTKMKTERLEIVDSVSVEENSSNTHVGLQTYQVSRTTRDTIDAHKNNFRQDLDVRGMRGDEALNAVQYFIDDAILVGMQQVRILHGKGNGILRQLRSEEHTSELQSRQYLVCRLLLEKKKKH